MPYYLSYIEINGHSALMLSEKANESEPTRIICELGFAPSLDVPINEVGYLTTHKGHVREESNASRALYSMTSDVKHRTYEISQAEVERFFILLNRDRAVNVAPIRLKGSKEISYIGGPDYQKVSNNCKTYAIGLLKEIGISDAEVLSNFMIQRTSTKAPLLKKISREELSCPMKENLIEKISSVLTELNLEIETLKSELSGEECQDELKEKIEDLLRISNQLLQTKEKIGIMVSMTNKYTELSSLIDAISVHKEVTGKEKLKKELEEIVHTATHMSRLSNESRLEFVWKITPILSLRADLSSFNPQEKAIYLTKVKVNELLDGLEQIISDIDEKLSKVKKSEQDLYADLIALKEIVEKSKISATKSKQIYMNAIEQGDPEAIMTISAKQAQDVDRIISDFEKEVSDFEPKSKETSAIVRYINKIIGYFKKDFITVENTESLVKDSVETLKKSEENLNTKLSKSINLINKEPVQEAVPPAPEKWVKKFGPKF